MNKQEWKKLTDGQKIEVENFWREKLKQALFYESYEKAERELIKIRKWKNGDVK